MKKKHLLKTSAKNDHTGIVFPRKQWVRNPGSFLKLLLFLTTLTLLKGQLDAQTYTFTPAGATGHTGPTQNDVNNAYSATNLSGSVTIVTQGIQQFIIPAAGAYGIQARGAQGYGAFGGRGAEMYGEFQFTAGQVLKILVGQAATPPVGGTNQYGGGGGSFVTDLSNTPFIVAGGGGGSSNIAHTGITDASVNTTGNAGANSATNGAGGINGGGGGQGSTSFGGGGFTGDGTGAQGGKSFINGGIAGTGTGNGGFGGGGGCTGQNNYRMGGGGGYSGGGGSGSTAPGSTPPYPEAGGGGSYNAGTNQLNVPGVGFGDGEIIITRLCNLNLNASTNPICYGENVTLSTNAGSPINWSSGGTLPTTVVSPTATSSYTVTGAGTGTISCIGSAVIIVTVIPLPVLSAMVTPPVLCVGDAATLTISGVNSYTWSSGLSGLTPTVDPVVTTMYTVSGADGSGCTNSATLNVSVNTNSLSVSPATTICQGDYATISASGAVTYTWSNGNLFQVMPVSPVTNTIYNVTGTDIHGCKLTNAVPVAVNTLPNVTASVDKGSLCTGEPFVLSASGANTYTWNHPLTGTATGATLGITPTIDIPYIYTVDGTDNNGCRKSSLVTVYVNRCTGLGETEASGSSAAVYPNPGSGVFIIESSSTGGKIEVNDYTGRLVASFPLEGEKTPVDLSGLANGIYYLKIQSGVSVQVLKAVKQ